MVCTMRELGLGALCIVAGAVVTAGAAAQVVAKPRPIPAAARKSRKVPVLVVAGGSRTDGSAAEIGQSILVAILRPETSQRQQDCERRPARRGPGTKDGRRPPSNLRCAPRRSVGAKNLLDAEAILGGHL